MEIIDIKPGEALTPEQELEKIKAERDNLLQTKETLVNEVKELRTKKQLTEQEKEELIKKVAQLEKPEIVSEPDVLSKVEELFSKKESEAKAKNKEKAMNAFLAKHPELSESNDEGGLRKSAFEKKLSMFNLDNKSEIEDYISVFESAYTLLGNTKKEDINNPEIINTPIVGGQPRKEGDDVLSQKEIDYINKYFKGNKERYLELKSKYPQVINL